MNRREALGYVGLILGGTVIGGAAFLEGCKTDNKASALFSLSEAQIAFLDEVAETIIPTTDTPGAKAARVGRFMQTMVNDCYKTEDQKIFLEGINMLDKAAKSDFGKDFLSLNAEQRTTLLSKINVELKQYNEKKTDKDPAHYFGMFKQLTLLGYFTSEIGATQALRYVAIPGKYEGCVPYKKGDRAWA